MEVLSACLHWPMQTGGRHSHTPPKGLLEQPLILALPPCQLETTSSNWGLREGRNRDPYHEGLPPPHTQLASWVGGGEGRSRPGLCSSPSFQCREMLGYPSCHCWLALSKGWRGGKGDPPAMRTTRSLLAVVFVGQGQVLEVVGGTSPLLKHLDSGRQQLQEEQSGLVFPYCGNWGQGGRKPLLHEPSLAC